jgi:RimJ/RimL family protein N-acetyltransferase
VTFSLRRLDEPLLADLLSVATTDATPDEVMPPVDGPPGWTHARREAFLTFHRDRFGGLDAPLATVMYAIVVDGAVAGMIRLARTATDGAYETGMWLGRGRRGQGLGVAAVRALLDEARLIGARAVIADTTPGNAAALGALRSCGAMLTVDDSQGKVLARIAVAPGFDDHG